MKNFKKFLKYQGYLSLAIKLILILSIINSINIHLWHIASTNIFLLILMFIPQILKKSSKIEFPKEFEFFLLIFVIITLFLGKIGTIIAPIIFGIATGFIGFAILFFLYSSNQIKKNYFLIILFSFNFSVTFGILLEIVKYYLKLILGQSLNTSIYTFTMTNITYVLVGSAIAAILGYLYMKTHVNFFSKVLKSFKKSNPNISFDSDFSEEIKDLVKKGEKNKIEFKSTLRTNLHTKKIDKNIEKSSLKTIVGFLNSEGGTLLIGISDDGEIGGIEKDNFPNEDKFNLHLINLIKEKIGKKNLHLIDIKTGKVDGKGVAKIDCSISKIPVFLKDGKEEFFYIRIGPSTTELKASHLIEYIDKKFKKKG